MLQSPSRFQPAHDRKPPDCAGVEPVALAPEDRLRADRHRHVIRAPDFQPEETGGRNPDHLHRMVVEREFAADDRTIAAQFALPKLVADDGARQATATAAMR